MIGERLALVVALTAAEVVERIKHLLVGISVRWAPERAGRVRPCPPEELVGVPEMTIVAARRQVAEPTKFEDVPTPGRESWPRLLR
jgi:hypothetical protein